MTKKFSTLALMAFLASWLTVAGAQNTTSRPAADTKAAAAQKAMSDNAKQDGRDQSSSAKSKNKKKTQHRVKPAPSKEEQDLAKVLQGIYG